MGDWVALATSRWKLRKAIKITNQTLHELTLKKHPYNNFIERIKKKLDFLD